MKRILVAPLDWGLGHATRCIPIIRELLSQNAEVVIAAYGRSFDLLKKEFPLLTVVRLPGYAATYPDDKKMARKMLFDMPRILSATITEHRMLKKMIASLDIVAIISDSRFGLFSKKIKSVYITHQTGIIMPPSLKWAEQFVNKVHRLIISRYDECWIPDNAGKENLSGDLSHRYPLPSNSNFIGPLSRFGNEIHQELEYDLLVVLSGPEPQRTLLENLITQQLKYLSITALIIRGMPEQNQQIRLSETITVISSLTTEKLHRAMKASKIILARPGYSTIMDLNALHKKAIFVPTPGQTEQEYLAGLFDTRKVAYYETQEQFDVRRALERSKEYTGFVGLNTSKTNLTEKIQHLLSIL